MKYLVFLVFVLSLNATSLSDYINNENCDQIIDKIAFKICYDYGIKGALFVGYDLQNSLVNKKNIKKRESFYSEKNIPIEYRSKSKDYLHSGYDKGHLASDASFDYDKRVLKTTYIMANIIPQAPKVNRYTWAKVERLERSIAVKLGSVSVVNGILYDSEAERIGKNEIAVPSAFWKIIYNNKAKYKKCFYYKNDNNIDVKSDRLRSHLVLCDTLENTL